MPSSLKNIGEGGVYGTHTSEKETDNQFINSPSLFVNLPRLEQKEKAAATTTLIVNSYNR